MSDMSLEMIHKNLTDWLDDIVTGVKASQRQIQCRPTDEYAYASVGDDNPVLLHGFEYAVEVLQPKIEYCVRDFWVRFHNKEEYKDTPKWAKYFNYDGVDFFTYVYSEKEIENAREQSSDSGTFEELPVLDF